MQTASRRRVLGAALVAMGGSVCLAGCGAGRLQPSGASGTKTTGQTGTAASQTTTGGATSASRTSDPVYMTILSGKMAGKSGWPMFVPADFTVTAQAATPVEIRCFDNGAAPVAAAYTSVKGTVGGTISVLSQVTGSLSSASARTVSALAAGGIAHTFTVATLGLNVPIPPLSTVRFSFNPGKAGKLSWQCMAACSTGASGMGGAMVTDGWMRGTITVQA